MANVHRELKLTVPAEDCSKLKERLKAEQDKSKLLKSALDMAYEGVVIVDAQGVVTMISQAYLEFLGIEEKDAVGRHVTEVLENTRMHIVAKTGKAEEAQLQKINNRYIIANRHPIIIDGELKGAVGKMLFRDVKELDYLYNKFSKVQLELEKYKEEIQQQYSARYSFSDIIGSSPEILAAKQLAQKAAPTDSNVLLLGASGTEKELFAQAIHKSSSRSYGYFIKVDCAAIPSDLLESELIGCEEGAFAGAGREGKKGRLELADGGTIFLDEIGEMPLHMQDKLLRALRGEGVERLGSAAVRNVDIRVIAATNQDLEQLVAEKKFRADLFFRLGAVTIRIPPLRARKEDIVMLSYAINKVKSQKLGRPVRYIPRRTMEYLKSYDWEGNVRQLENVIERAINILGQEEDEILPKHLPKEITGNVGNITVEKLSEMLLRAEDEAIRKAIKACGGNKLRAAKLLGISRNALYDRLNRERMNK